MCGWHTGRFVSVRPVTKEMIRLWGMVDVDWMGYKTERKDLFTFHHLIVPARKNGPYEIWNGAILNGSTGHPYLHTIENYDYDRFLYLTSKLIDMNALGKMDIELLKDIDTCLKYFEQEYQGKVTKHKKRIIKPEYTIRDYTSLK